MSGPYRSLSYLWSGITCLHVVKCSVSVVQGEGFLVFCIPVGRVLFTHPSMLDWLFVLGGSATGCFDCSERMCVRVCMCVAFVSIISKGPAVPRFQSVSNCITDNGGAGLMHA